ncbi:MAG: Ig-like domain-containing protein [Gemmatimonadaceae bacterium]|nr:Ig-like domain-containing protein [Gemmatimonadaceae bacterium]
MSNRIVTRCASLLLAAFVVAGCSDDEPTGIDVLPFDVSPISFAVDQGASKQMKITGIAMSDVTWESTNPAIASVSSTGLVTGVAVGGPIAITARSKANPTTDLASATFQVNAVLSGTVIQRNTDNIISLSARTRYRVFIPEGTTSVTFRLLGPNGDADFFVRFGAAPVVSYSASNNTSSSCVSAGAGTNESCTFTNPAEGTWYILVDPYEAFTDANLRVSTTP